MRRMAVFEDFLSALEDLESDTPAARKAFRRRMLRYYDLHGRVFPWRETRDPYRILVSEIMLQQTQTQRVAVKYPEFIKRFPSIRALARASQSEVLRAWEGLGYYRRARNLHRAAIAICEYYKGRVPRQLHELRSLPGVGDYTAAAVSVFAFDTPVAMIETNIRSVYLHVFFRGKRSVSDRDIRVLVEETLDRGRCREWFYALMDFGVELKKVRPGINARSRHHTKQSTFEGSDRQIAARILRQALQSTKGMRLVELRREFNISEKRLVRVVKRLIADGLIEPSPGNKIRAVA